MPPEPPTTRSPAHVGRTCVSALAIFASLVGCQSQEPQPEGVLEISAAQKDDYAVFSWMSSVSGRPHNTSLKEGAPGYFTTPEEVPADLAETAFFNMRGSIEADPLGALAHLFAAAGLLSRCTVEAFHFPDALARTLVPAWTVEDVQFHFAQMRQATRGTPRVEYDSKISRNDPCPCGSGKKFKKCCLP